MIRPWDDEATMMDPLIRWREPRAVRSLAEPDAGRVPTRLLLGGALAAVAAAGLYWYFGLDLDTWQALPPVLAGLTATLLVLSAVLYPIAPTTVSLHRHWIAVDRVGLHRMVRLSDVVQASIREETLFGGHRHRLLRLQCKDESLVIGIADTVPVQTLASRLQDRGVNVVVGEAMPQTREHDTTP